MSKRRRILLLLGIPLGLVLLLVLSLLLALSTQPGLNTVLFLTEKLSKGQVAVQSGQGRLSSGITLYGLRYTASGIELAIGKLHLQWHPAALIRKELQVQELRLSSVHLRLPPAEEPEPAQTEPVRLPAFSFPLGLQAGHAVVEDLRIFSGEEEQFGLIRAEVEQLRALGQELHFEKLAVKNSWMDVQGKGQVRTAGDYPLQVELLYAFDFEGYGPIRGKGNLSGDLARLDVATVLSEPQAVDLQGEAVDVVNGLQWQALLKSPHLALAAINSNWPAQVFDQVQIQAKGDIRNYNLDVAGRLVSKELLRPLGLKSTLQVGWKRLVIEALRVTDASGHLDLAGTLDWSPALAWDAKISAEGVNPDVIVADLPGALSGKLSSRGSLSEGRLNTEVKIEALQGQLRGYPLSANGAATYQDGALNVPGVHAAVGRTTLDLQGTLKDTVALELKLDSPDLRELLPQLAGSLQAGGQAQGTRREPSFTVDLQGTGIVYADNRIERLSGKAQGVWKEQVSLQAALQARTLQLGNTRLDQAALSLKGTPASHILTVQADSKEDQLALELAGKKDGETWAGELRQLEVQAAAIGRWRQQKTAKLAFSAQEARIEPLCVQMEKAASLCLDGQWQKADGRWRGSAQLAGLPLSTAQPWLPPEMEISGLLSLDLQASGQGGRLGESRINGTSSGLRLNFLYGGAAAQNLVWKNHSFAATYKNERLEAGWSNELEDGSTLEVQLSSARLPLPGADLRQAPLQGSANFDIRKLSFLNALTRQQSRWTGMLRGHFDFGGSIGKPLVSGTMGLAEGEVLIPELGLRLAPLLVNLSGAEGVLKANAEAHSQQGQLQVEAGVDLSGEQMAFLPIIIQGDAFRLANQPGLVVDISPDIAVRFADERIDVNGKVAIPHARIETITFESAITPSGDVVVVDDPAGVPAARASMPVHARVTVAAGDDVIINTYGLHARIGGQLQLVQEPGRPLTGNGQLNVQEGSFSIYGKRVKIDSGRLLFSGGSLTNPGIEIRSENKADNITAGLRVDGFLNTPRVNLYSRPVMEQSAIVSHLIEDVNSLGGSTRKDTGLIGDTAKKLGMGGLVPYLEGIKQISMIDDIKLDTDSDSTSLVFGSWITKDFYVSYGKSLTGEGATFTTRYTLGKGFVVETESGEMQSSGDIKYEFEH